MSHQKNFFLLLQCFSKTRNFQLSVRGFFDVSTLFWKQKMKIIRETDFLHSSEGTRLLAAYQNKIQQKKNGKIEERKVAVKLWFEREKERRESEKASFLRAHAIALDQTVSARHVVEKNAFLSFSLYVFLPSFFLFLLWLLYVLLASQKLLMQFSCSVSK